MVETDLRNLTKMVEDNKPDEDFLLLATDAKIIQKELEQQNDFWKNSPFEWVIQLPAARKGNLRDIWSDNPWLENRGFTVEHPKNSYAGLSIKKHRLQ